MRTVPYLRMVVEEGEDSLRREQNRVHELQQQLEQERAASLHKEKEEEERRGVRTNINKLSKTHTPVEKCLLSCPLSAFLFI